MSGAYTSVFNPSVGMTPWCQHPMVRNLRALRVNPTKCRDMKDDHSLQQYLNKEQKLERENEDLAKLHLYTSVVVEDPKRHSLPETTRHCRPEPATVAVLDNSLPL